MPTKVTTSSTDVHVDLSSRRTVRGDHTLYIHPFSVLFEQRSPSWVIFNEVIQTSKHYMRDITVVSEVTTMCVGRHVHVHVATLIKDTFISGF